MSVQPMIPFHGGAAYRLKSMTLTHIGNIRNVVVSMYLCVWFICWGAIIPGAYLNRIQWVAMVTI